MSSTPGTASAAQIVDNNIASCAPIDHTHQHPTDLEELDEEEDVDPDHVQEAHDQDESHPGVTGHVVVTPDNEIASLSRIKLEDVYNEKIRSHPFSCETTPPQDLHCETTHPKSQATITVPETSYKVLHCEATPPNHRQHYLLEKPRRPHPHKRPPQ